MDMSKLRDSLPPGGRTDAERDLTNDFKAAALSITKLYKSSLAASASAWSAGYQAALSDLLEKCAALSQRGDIGLEDVRDWARARMEAVGGSGNASGELSDEEREREREERRREEAKAAATDDAGDRTPNTDRGTRTTYVDMTQDTPEPDRVAATRHTPPPSSTPFSSPVSSAPPPSSNTSKPRRRQQPLRESSNPPSLFPSTVTFAPSLPSIAEFPFFPASMFEPDPPITYGTGMKRRHDSLLDGDATSPAMRKARHRSNTDSMDVDGERDKKRRR